MRMNIVIDWEVSSFFGWGVFGINLALELAIRGRELTSTQPIKQGQIVLDELRLRKLSSFIARSNRCFESRVVEPGAAWLAALSNDFLGKRPPTARIGVVFFENPLSQQAIMRAREYDLIITGSSWNEAVLRAASIVNVRTVPQGVDRSLFHPAPKRGLYRDHFLIFSGGKAEPAKDRTLSLRRSASSRGGIRKQCW
jgi:hypothetical protein